MATTEWYRRLVENSPDGICVIRHGRVVFVNAAGVRLMGAHTADQLIGRPVGYFIASEPIPTMLADIAKLANPGDSTPHCEVQMIRCDGSRLHVEVVTVKMIWDGDDALQVITRDVSARHAAEAATRYQAALVNHVSDAIIGTTADGLVTSWNPAAETIYGRCAAEAIGLPITTAVGAGLEPATVVASGGIAHARHHAGNGQVLDVRISAAAMADGYVLVCSDLTALLRAQQHFEAVVGSMIEGLIVTDKDGRIKSINPSAMRIMGAPAGTNLIGINFFEATENLPFYDEDGVNIPPRERPAVAVMHTGVASENVVYGWDRAEGRGWLLSTCRLVDPDLPGQSDLLISFTDITAQRADADEMKYLATHDGLTSLLNRAAVLRRINEALQDTAGAVRLRAVLFIDVDDLKVTNDTHGHEVGDDVLRATAERLRSIVAADDVVGRWGGDEFVVMICRDLSTADLDDLVARLCTELAVPASAAVAPVSVGASVGVVEVDLFERRTAEEIVRAADLAMYEAKRGRR